MSWNLFFCLCVSKSDTFDWSLYPFKTICAFIGCESLLSGKSCFGVLLQTERKVQPMWLNQSRAASSNKHSGKWKFFIQEQKTNLSTCLHILHSFNWIQMFQLAIVLLAYRFESKSWTEKGTWMSVFFFCIWHVWILWLKLTAHICVMLVIMFSMIWERSENDWEWKCRLFFNGSKNIWQSVQRVHNVTKLLDFTCHKIDCDLGIFPNPKTLFPGLN